MGVRVRKHHTGKWGVFVNHRGQRRALIRWTSKKEAELVAAKIRKDLSLADLGLNQPREKVSTFSELAESWYQAAVNGADGLAPSTARNYRRYLDRYLLPAFGSRPITQISRQDIREFARANLGRVSYGYINNVLNPLRLVLQEAVEDGLLPSNPAHKLNLQMRTKKKREKDLNPLSLSELSLLLDTLRQRHEDYYPLFLTVAHTGLRMGELRALMWSDVQFGQGGGGKNRYITVQRSYSHGHLSTPKSGRTRMVDLSKDLREILLSHQMKEYMKGRGQPEDLVFYGEEGGHISDSTVQRILKASLAIAGLRSVTFHSLRHSYATIMLYELGIPIQYVSHQLGHSSIKVTVDTYGHPRQGSNIAFVDGLSEQLSATSSQPVEQEAAQVPV